MNKHEVAWMDEAACRDHPAEWWTDQVRRQSWRHGANGDALRVCWLCPVRTDCLDYALRVETGWAERWGIWGGLTPKERTRVVLNRTRTQRNPPP